MKLTIAAVPAALGRFDLKIREPGHVRYVAFEERKTLVMTAGRPGFEEQPVLFVEASPEAPIIERHFVAVPHGAVIDIDDGERAVWRGTGVSGRGMVVHVFELVAASKPKLVAG